MSKSIRIGGASGFWGDSVVATPQLLNGNNLDFIVYDYLAEITMSIMARARAKDPNKGYAIDFVSSVLKLNLKQIADQKIKVLSNAGGVNPEACAQAIRDLIIEQKLDLKVAVVLGDDLILSFGGSLSEAENCKQVFKKEAQEFGLIEESCNPITKGLDADYILIYISGERFRYNENLMLHTLEGGGDESKKIWFARISNQQVSKFVQQDGITPTDYFMQNSTLGKLIPFSIVKFVEPNTGRAFDQYIPGSIPVYAKNIKYLDTENDPFYLVYASPSFYSEIPGPLSTVLIYRINPNYNP